MKYKIIIGVFLVLWSLQSCKDTLKVEPVDFFQPHEFYKNKEELNYALNGVYSTLTASSSPYQSFVARMGLDADEGYINYAADRNSLADYRVVASDSRILSYWTVFYAGINKANDLLINIDNAQVEEGEKLRVKGETLFLRAYFYLMLVNRFGDIPLVLTPITSVAREELQVPQTPAKDVYEKILEDMEEASELVGDATHPGKVSKSAIWGIMARTCLYMAGKPINEASKYAEAKEWALKVIGAGIHVLNTDYTQVFINYAQDKYDIRESIWEVEYWGNGSAPFQAAAGFVGRNNGIGTTRDPSIGYSLGALRNTEYLYKLYDDPHDVRRDWNIAPFYYGGSAVATKTSWAATQLFHRHCGKWRREYEILAKNDGRTPQNYPLLRYSDVLLMFAEADCISSNSLIVSPEGHEALNKVRRRARGLDPLTPNLTIDLKDLNKSQFMEEIMDERARELAFESLRKSDLVRWGNFYDKMRIVYDELQPYLNSTSVSIKDRAEVAVRSYSNVSRRDVLWPIPTYELGVNNKLKQNSGW